MHVIRLWGPWQLALVDRAVEGALENARSIGQFSAPNGLGNHLPVGYGGWIRVERVFHRPTGLSDETFVRLRVAVDMTGHAAINGQLLGALVPGECLFDIGSQLQLQNRIGLDLLIDAPGSMSQPICDVRLEIFE